MTKLRRPLALILFLALALLSIDRGLLKFAFADRAKLAEISRVDRDTSEYRQFLEDVRNRTRPGDSIGLMVPLMRWRPSYSTAYFRACYTLAGREVLPLIRDDNSPAVENLARAKYVAAWRRDVTDATRRVVWRGDRGVLLER